MPLAGLNIASFTSSIKIVAISKRLTHSPNARTIRFTKFFKCQLLTRPTGNVQIFVAALIKVANIRLATASIFHGSLLNAGMTIFGHWAYFGFASADNLPVLIPDVGYFLANFTFRYT